MKRRLASLAAACVLCTSLRALADGPSALDHAAAEALFRDAMALVATHDYATACPKLEESQKLEPGMAKQFRLAECYEATGKTASAWASFVEVADAAVFEGKADREKVARDRAGKLEPKLSHATIVVATPDVPGLEVKRGDHVLGKAQWGSPMPVDPATYVIAVSAPGKKTFKGSITVAPDGDSQTLTVPALEDEVVAVEAPKPPPDITREVEQRVHEESQRQDEQKKQELLVQQRKANIALGYLLIGAGAVVAAGGAAVAIIGKVWYESAGSDCQGSTCNLRGLTTTQDARNLEDPLAPLLLGIGAASALVGVGVLVFSPRVPVKAAFSPRGIAVQGSF